MKRLAADCDFDARAYSYMLRVLTRLSDWRREDTRRLYAYWARLCAFNTSDSWADTPASPPGLWFKVRGFILRPWERVRQLALFLFSVPAVAKQLRLMRLAPTTATDRTLVLAIASGRLQLPAHVSVRASLALFAAPVGNPLQSAVPDLIQKTARLLVFDPQPISSWGTRRADLWGENVFIVDGAVLAVCFLREILIRPLALAASYRRLRGAVPKGADQTPAASIAFPALVSFRTLLDSAGAIEAVFLTSNSILTELLRAYLATSPQCEHIQEVFHGMSGETQEEFFQSFIEDGGTNDISNKHSFVPQVPGLPLFGVFREHLTARPYAAIHQYLSQQLVQALLTEQDATAFVKKKVGRVAGKRTLIVSMFGAPNTPSGEERAAERAKVLEIECLLLERVARLCEESATDYQFLYVRHPRQKGSLRQVEVFNRLRVRHIDSSLAVWMVSDLTLSVYSSATFESAYFGGAAFTPLCKADRIYAPYLDLVFHPLDDSSGALDRALEQAVNAARRSHNADLNQTIEQRLAKTSLTAITTALQRQPIDPSLESRRHAPSAVNGESLA